MDKFLGLPIHPLLVHAPVIIVPAFILIAICYAAAPALRRRIGWAVVILSVLAPVSAIAGWWSGHRFYHEHIAMITKAGSSPEKFKKLLAEHLAYGDILVWAVGVLSVVVWALALLSRRTRVADEPAIEAASPESANSDAMATAEAEPRPTAPPATPAAPVRVALVVLAVAVIGLSGAAGWYTFQTGHSGAKVVWGQPKGGG